MWPKKSRQGFFTAKNRKHLLKLKYPEQVAEPESPITVRIFLFDAVSFKKRYLPTAPFSYKNIQEKLSMINVGGGCGEFVIINMNEIRRK